MRHTFSFILNWCAKSSKITVYNFLKASRLLLPMWSMKSRISHGCVTSLQSFFDWGLSEMERKGMLLRFVHILITLMYFKGQGGISKSVKLYLFVKWFFAWNFLIFWIMLAKHKKEKKNTGKALCISSRMPSFLMFLVSSKWKKTLKYWTAHKIWTVKR